MANSRRATSAAGWSIGNPEAGFPLVEGADAGLVPGDVRLQLGLGRGKLFLGLVNLVHHLEFPALQLPDGALGGLDFVAQGLKFVVFAHQRLLGAVFGQLPLRRADLRLDHLFARFQLPQLQPGGLNGGLFGGNLLLHGGNIPGDRLQMGLQTMPFGVAIL